MLTTNLVEGTNIVTASYSGSVASEEMDHLHSTTRQVVDREGSVRMMLEFDDTESDGILPKGYVEDLQMAGILSGVKRLALVTDSTWIRGNAELFTAVIEGPVKNFTTDNRDEALTWLQE